MNILNKLARRLIYGFLLFAVIATLFVVYIDYYVGSAGTRMEEDWEVIPEVDAIIVFGAYVFPDGTVSRMLKDRLDFGYKMYKLEKSDRIIVTGDNGQVNYDEVNAMRLYLESKGVPRENIFMDHAGFNTYDSLYRARDIFKVDKAILVSQAYHLKRAYYIATRLGLEAYNVPADTLAYPNMRYYRLREVGARVKAFLQAGVFKPEPKFLGDAIPIWKSGELTHDGKS